MALAREQRIANMLTRAGVGAASVQAATRTAVAPATRAPAKRAPAKLVGNTLRTQLVERFKLTCTKCFTAAIQQLNATPIAEVRARPGDFAKSVYENAKEGRGTAALLEWADFKTHGFARYEQLILEACDACEPHLPPGAIVYDANRHGFGDAMVAAWIGEGSKGTDRPLVLYATGEKAELLRLFGQQLTETPQPGMLATHNYEAELRWRGKVQRLRNRATRIGAGGTPKRPTATIPSDIQEWADGIVTDRTILLYPQSAYRDRTWPLSYWVELRALLVAADFSVETVALSEIREVRSRQLTWSQNVALMQRAILTIGNESGPMHVAGTLDRPALAICGPTTRAGVFDHLPSVRAVAADPNDVPCVGCWYNDIDRRPVCKVECRALLMTSPQRVYQAAMELL